MTDENESQNNEESTLKTSVSLLFAKYIDHDPDYEFRVLENYYKYLADRIDPNRIIINADAELLEAFESVSLLLRERLILLPNAVKYQIDTIFEQENLLQTFSILSNIPKHELLRIRLNHSTLFDLFYLVLKPLKSFAFLSRNYGLTPTKLFNIKIGLKRISQIIKYISIIDTIDYDTVFNEFRDHYNPDFVNRNKLNALINIL